MGIIFDETGTRVRVEADTSNIDDCINNIDPNIFGPAIDILNDIKEKIEDSKDILADKVSELLRSWQEQIIIANQSVDTGQMRDTIFIDPFGEGEYEVGPTALSMDGYPYPIVIDQGSVKYDGKPFVEPSIEQTMNDIDETSREVFNNIF